MDEGKSIDLRGGEAERDVDSFPTRGRLFILIWRSEINFLEINLGEYS